MLEFRDVIDHVDGLAIEAARRSRERAEQLQTALKRARLDARSWAREHQRILHSTTAWLTARPLSGNSPAEQVCDPPTGAPDAYSALACDGSQIPIDRHEIAACYVINIGRVALHYGCDERPLLESKASVHYSDSDLYRRGADDDDETSGSLVSERVLANRRSSAELEAIGALIRDCADRPNPIAFVDNTLILWSHEAEPPEERKEAIACLMSLFELARAKRVPVVGYVSRPGSREVVGALRVSLCTLEQVACKLCPYVQDLPCAAIDRLCDADLFAELLRPGQRSGLFESRSRVLNSYAPADNKIAFFYLNTGSEIARIEMPKWVSEDVELLGRVHGLSLDQIHKGSGYPICLAEAHERAVVSAGERDVFFRLVERSFVRSGLRVARTAKSVAKRRGVV
jgi:hypothetical protein